ncbi:C-X-C motif chemokine 10-like [Brachyistius frenatus]|uniref:C-X-C motif chemokine 10-like n=1 Tax=Brachyistius frenatus TaxID=100188 RepID=UPI0037E8F0F7
MMSSFIKVFLLLALMVCVSEAQRESGQHCLCERVRDGIGLKSGIKDIQIYSATIFCDRVEIVVTNNNGRFCLNPNLKAIKKLLANVISRRQKTSTDKPNGFTASRI